MLIPHKGHTDTIQVYSVTVMTHVKALQAGHSSQGTSEPITPAQLYMQPTQADVLFPVILLYILNKISVIWSSFLAYSPFQQMHATTLRGILLQSKCFS